MHSCNASCGNGTMKRTRQCFYYNNTIDPVSADKCSNYGSNITYVLCQTNVSCSGNTTSHKISPSQLPSLKLHIHSKHLLRRLSLEGPFYYDIT